MIREMVGSKAVTSLFDREKNRNAMSTTMIGVVGTAVGIGVAYMAMKNRNKG